MIGHTKATGACYTNKQAGYLPEKVYTCKKLADEDSEEDAAAEAVADDEAVADEVRSASLLAPCVRDAAAAITLRCGVASWCCMSTVLVCVTVKRMMACGAWVWA